MDAWIRLREDNTATAFGAAASHILLRHRGELDEIHRNWGRQTRIDKVFDQLGYVRNVYYLLDERGYVRAAGKMQAHVEAYMQDGWTVLIRESLETVTQ